MNTKIHEASTEYLHQRDGVLSSLNNYIRSTYLPLPHSGVSKTVVGLVVG